MSELGSQPEVFEGLEKIMVARTRLSHVDGEQGRLIVRGRAIEELAGSVPFEAMFGLLLGGELPSAHARQELARELGLGRARAHELLLPCWPALRGRSAMSALVGALSALPAGATPALALGVAAVASAAWARSQQALPLLEPAPELGHAADLLRLLHGASPSAAEAELLDAYLVTVADHGFNASTFAARVVASTGAELSASLVAGVCALSGPLHGGAPGPVLDMLDAIGSAGAAPGWVQAELAAGRRIMGMGHRVYRVRDPRAFVLERALRRFQAGAGAERLALARAVELAAEAELGRRHPGRALRANVEFYTAILLEALALPRALFSALFACARVLGYAAHHAEQQAGGRLIRPSALYVGALPG